MSQQPHQWNLSSLATNDNDEKLVQRRNDSQDAINSFVSKWQKDDSYLVEASKLAAALADYETILHNHGINGWEWYYYNLRSAQDQLDPQLKALTRKAIEASDKQFNQILFFFNNLKKISVEKQTEFLNSAALAPYRHFLEREFAAIPHLLSLEEERLLNLVSQPAHGAWVNMVSSFLSREVHHTLHDDGQIKAAAMPTILSLTSSRKPEVRTMAAELVNQLMTKYADTATEELNAILYYKKITDELRRYDRPDTERHISDDIDSEVVDSLTNAVAGQFQLAQDYYKLKAELFHVDKLAYHERNVPYGELSQEYDFNQAYSLVEHTLSDLDAEFGHIFTQFLHQGQFDVFPRPGKVGGAFCAHNLVTQPTFILLNHTNRLQDVLTLAHEMGHGLHNEMARKNQTALNFGTSLATAEVASTFMEDFVIDKLLENTNKTTQLELLMMKLNDDISSIFRQVACYRFEQALHQQFRQQGYLSTEEIGKLFQVHMSAYMGSFVEQSEGSQNWWVYWSHIRNFFYVYSYASGLLISKSLQSLVRKDPKNIQKVKDFMSAGQADSPRKIFMDIGIDIQQPQFWQQGLLEVQSLLNQAKMSAIELNLIQNTSIKKGK
jgi:oligoendopeptidase F